MSGGDQPTRNSEDSPTDQDQEFQFDTPQAPSFYEDDDDGLESTQVFDNVTDAVGFDPLDFVCPFGKYELLDVVGKGGAGIVYRAKSKQAEVEGEFYAIKFLRPEVLSSRVGIQRFRKESRLQSEIDSPFVTRHFEFGQYKGAYFIVSEFVDGINVSDFCKKDATISIKLALLITRDLLRGLSALHEIGIVHRDVKPGNLIACFKNGTTEPNESNFTVAKLTDFGLARHIEQSESLEMTRQQTVLGTPLYMAPEQYLESRSVDARADIYSVGGALFHLLAGRPPLTADNMALLGELHRVERPVALSKINPQIGEAISNLVAKSLEKDPELRYQDASDMLKDIEQVLADNPISLRVYPAVPDGNARGVKKYDFEWELDAAVSDLWPLVTDTDRFNRAIGLPSPQYTYDHSDQERKIFAEAKFNGMKVRWREHPFQWVREREMSVLREFESGPFEWMTSTVELSPLSRNRTRLIHRMQVKPRGLLGRLVVPLQFGWLTKRALDRVYQRLEQLANDVNPLACDLPFGKPIHLSAAQENAIEDRTRLLKHDPELTEFADKLAEVVRTAADPQVARICPVPLARKLNCDVDRAVDACLGAVEVGMFNLSWDVICPVCRVASQTKNSLKAIQSHTHCDVCNLDFEVDFARSVELIFSVHPSLRTVELATYCIGGPYHAPHIIAQNHLKPGEKIDVGAALAPGSYGLKSRQLNSTVAMLVDETALLKRVDIELGKSLPASVPKLLPGNVCVALDNQSPIALEIRLEKDPQARDSVTAADVSSHPKFKQLFPNEQINIEDLVEVSSVFLLMVYLVDADARIESVGDLQNRSDWKIIRDAVTGDKDEGCTVVETAEDQLIVAFDTAEKVVVGLGRMMNVVQLELYAIVVNQGQVMTGIDFGQPEVFGKAVRSTKSLIRDLPAGQMLVCKEAANAAGFEGLDVEPATLKTF